MKKKINFTLCSFQLQWRDRVKIGVFTLNLFFHRFREHGDKWLPTTWEPWISEISEVVWVVFVPLRWALSTWMRLVSNCVKSFSYFSCIPQWKGLNNTFLLAFVGVYLCLVACCLGLFLDLWIPTMLWSLCISWKGWIQDALEKFQSIRWFLWKLQRNPWCFGVWNIFFMHIPKIPIFWRNFEFVDAFERHAIINDDFWMCLDVFDGMSFLWFLWRNCQMRLRPSPLGMMLRQQRLEMEELWTTGAYTPEN